MDLYYIIIFFVLGTVMGSFYNVVGDRLPNNESIVKPRSHCPKCHHILSPLELIPILSYVFQKGKCKNCKASIPIVHPLFEILSGIMFALTYYIFKLTPELAIALTFISMLLIILVSDMNYMIIPDEVLLITFILLFIEKIIIYGLSDAVYTLIPALLAFITMFLIKKLGDVLFKRESMGGGDIKLLFIFGYVLGYPLALLSIFVGSILGLPLSYFLMKITKSHEIPFGPLLSLGAIIIYFSQMNFNQIIDLLNWMS